MGGHGGLNILPQKSWNVYNFENREKVRQDEEEHAQKLAEEREQQLQRDAEARRSLLLERVRQKRLGLDAASGEICVLASSGVAAVSDKHINLFEDMVETGARENGVMHKNSRKAIMRSQETKVEDIKYSLGYGATGEKPWYLNTLPNERRPAVHGPPSGNVSKDGDFVNRKRASSADGNSGKRKKTVEELRQERLQREQQERERSHKVLSANRPSVLSRGGEQGSIGGVGSFKAPRARPPRYNSAFGFGK